MSFRNGRPADGPEDQDCDEANRKVPRPAHSQGCADACDHQRNYEKRNRRLKRKRKIASRTKAEAEGKVERTVQDKVDDTALCSLAAREISLPLA